MNNKIGRKIFQPTNLTSKIIEGYCGEDGSSITDFVNLAIESAVMPQTAPLKDEITQLFSMFKIGFEINQLDMKSALSRCIYSLKDYPISDLEPLKQVMLHFTSGTMHLRYDYVQIVTPEQDEILTHLNEIIKTLDKDYNAGKREFGERCRYIYHCWDQVCEYAEIYIALATIIDLEDIYYPLDLIRTVRLINGLDLAIKKSNLTPIKTPFMTDLSTTEKYFAVKYAILTYESVNAYAALTGDESLAHMPEEIDKYTNDIINITPLINGEPTKEQLDEVIEFEKRGRLLYSKLRKYESDNIS